MPSLIDHVYVRPPKTTRWEQLRDIIVAVARPVFNVDIRQFEDLGLALPLATAFCATMIIVFFSFVSVLVQQQMNQTYLSLDSNVPQSVCTSVSIAITAMFEGSLDGVWRTSYGYNTNTSIYEVYFDNSRLTFSDYQNAMRDFQGRISTLGQRTANRTHMHNVLSWNSFGFTNKDYSMAMDSNVDVGLAFDREVTLAVISNKDGVCISGNKSASDEFLSGSFDPATRSLQLSMPIAIPPDYMQNVYVTLSDKTALEKLNQENSCLLQTQKKNYVADEWKASLRDGKATFSFDVAGFSMAATLNLNLTTTDTFTEVTTPRMLGFKGYIDPWFQPVGMNPVWCLDLGDPRWGLSAQQQAGPPVCFVQTNEGISAGDLYYPLWGQYWADETQCPEVSAPNGSTAGPPIMGSCRRRLCLCNDNPSPDELKYCSQENYFFGFVTGNIDTKGQHDDDYNPDMKNLDVVVKFGLKMQNYMIDDPVNGDVAIQEFTGRILTYSLNVGRAPALANQPIRSWTKTASSSSISPISHHKAVFYDNSWAHGKSYAQLLREAWMDVCENCSAVIFEEMEGFSMANRINKYGTRYASLYSEPSKSHSCGDLISQTAAFEGLISVAPTDLTYPYFQCRKSWGGALISNLGSALASANFLAIAGWFVMGWIILQVLKRVYPESPAIRSERHKTLLNDLYIGLKDKAENDFDKSIVEAIKFLLDENAKAQANIADLERHLNLPWAEPDQLRKSKSPHKPHRQSVLTTFTHLQNMRGANLTLIRKQLEEASDKVKAKELPIRRLSNVLQSVRRSAFTASHRPSGHGRDEDGLHLPELDAHQQRREQEGEGGIGTRESHAADEEEQVEIVTVYPGFTHPSPQGPEHDRDMVDVIPHRDNPSISALRLSEVTQASKEDPSVDRSARL